MLTFAIKSAIVLAALYIPYTLLLRSETFVRLNRAVLLSILMLSLALPLINLPFLAVDFGLTPNFEIGPLSVVHDTAAEQADLSGLSQLTANDNPQLPIFNYISLLSLLYIIGVLVALAVRTIQLAALRRRIKRGCLWTQTESDGTIIYCHAEPIAPFSWFNQIVISQSDYDDCGETILRHERAHAALHHSADMMLAMAIQALQWFNPFVWLLADSLQEIHEYEADRQVLTAGTDIRQYQLLLIKKTVGRAWPAFTNSLKSNQLKNRFKMMLQRQSSPWRRARVLYVLPIAFVALSVFATPPQPSPQGEGAGTLVSTAEEDSAVVMSDVNEAPVLVLENARVDEEKGVVEFKEAHVETPAATSPTQTAQKLKNLNSAKRAPATQKLTDDYLVIVDGVPQDGLKLEDINKDDIESITVLKDEDAKKPFVEKYGEKAKTAVVLITMKDDRVFDICEELPTFPGGEIEMYSFMMRNLRYPKDAVEWAVQGRVQVSFIVEKDGKITSARAISNTAGDNWKEQSYEIEGVTVTGYGKHDDGSIVTKAERDAIIERLSAEAVRVVNAMPNWTPGKQRGKYVRVKFTIPITFRLS